MTTDLSKLAKIDSLLFVAYRDFKPAHIYFNIKSEPAEDWSE